MISYLPLVFVFPLIGFLILAFGRGRLSENLAAIVGVGSVGLSAATTAYVGYDFLTHLPASGAYVVPLWTWMSVGSFNVEFALKLDGLSLTMLSVITGVGFLIHLFASWYMRGDYGYGRFLSYMNLFVASMLFLVLGDDLLGQAMRLVRGIDVTEDSTSIEAMKEVCLGGPGHYLGSEQTLSLMQTEYVYPKVGNRMSPKEWNEAGKPLLLDTAIRRKNDILSKAGCRVDPEIDAAIRARFNIYFR